jgi:hypothetical protein
MPNEKTLTSDANQGTGHSIWNPEKSEWTLSAANVQYTPDKGEEPNWFHRKMQELVLGFKWRKL